MTPKHTLAEIQSLYPFKQPLALYEMGVSGKPEKPEAKAQKALIACLMAEFPKELGHNEALDIYSALVVATSDFYDPSKTKTRMTSYKKMGYQRGTLDITILYSPPFHRHSAFVCEMKSESTRSAISRATDEQKATIKHLEASGYYTCCANGFADALWHWLEYLGEV